MSNPNALFNAQLDRLAFNGIVPDAEGFFPAAIVEQFFHVSRYDFVWNADYTAARPVPMQWWDDASYMAYQGDCGDDYEEVNLPLDLFTDLWEGVENVNVRRRCTTYGVNTWAWGGR